MMQHCEWCEPDEDDDEPVLAATEPSVQVPVSQLEKWRDDLAALLPAGTYAIRNELDALLSQPTPSADPMCTCGHIMDDHDLSETRECQVAAPWCPCTNATDTAAPPSIADMAPGTEFLCEGRRVPGVEHHMRVTENVYRDGTRILWCLTHEFGAAAPYVDPSTIRDVRGPEQ